VHVHPIAVVVVQRAAERSVGVDDTMTAQMSDDSVTREIATQIAVVPRVVLFGRRVVVVVRIGEIEVQRRLFYPALTSHVKL